MSKPKEGCMAAMEKSEREAFIIRWKYITHKLKASGYDLSLVRLKKGEYVYGEAISR